MQVPGLLLILVLLLIVIVLARTAAFGRHRPTAQKQPEFSIDEDAAAQHLAAAVRIPTISTDDGQSVVAAFHQLHHLLLTSYPRVHASLVCEKVNQHSLLYTWSGSSPALQPVVLSAHLDVVPADPASLDQWQHAPFSGDIAGGFIWGRGTLDVKNQLIAVMEAVEALLAQGYQPRRTLMLAFGHDEEVSGKDGARQIVEILKQRGVHPLAVLDEGGAVTYGLVPGIKVPAALVGISEKGYLTIELNVEAEPGHSSTPPRQTAIGILSRALHRLETHPLPYHMSAPLGMFEGLGKAAPFVLRLAFANLWLLGGMVRNILEQAVSTNATLRTTTALTMVSGGIKDNVLPSRAQALVNFRLLPGDSVENVITFVRRIVADVRVRVQVAGGNAWEASPVSPATGPVFEALEQTIGETFGDIPVAAYLVLGATDARYYASISENVYRFTPTLLAADDLKRIHGHNERIAIDHLANMVRFFIRLIQKWDHLPD
jgi:carboxypeptidase PM20D1